MKINKGQYGYRDSSRKMRLFLVIFFLAAILLQLAARNFTDNQAAKNILTVMAILTVLPMANIASPLLASWKYRTPSRTFYDKVKGYETVCPILYDLVVTTKEDVLPFDAAAVHPNGIFAFTGAGNIRVSRAEEALNALFSANRLPPNVKIITDEKSFFKRLESLRPASEYPDDGTISYACALMKNLSM